MLRAEKHSFYIGQWRVEPQLNQISDHNESYRVEQKVMNVLLCLANNAQRLVTRDTLIKSAWEEQVVSDGSLSRNISVLRKILKSDFKLGYIETIPKKGYRLRCKVRVRVVGGEEKLWGHNAHHA